MADEPYEKRAREFSLAQVNAMCVYVEAERDNERLRKLCAELFVLANDGLMELSDQEFERICNEAKELGVIDEQVD